MASFTVRVELHRASADDYEALHSAMEAQGFTRTILSDDGQRYHMPWAEYDGGGNLSSMQVLGIAQKAAVRIGRENSILVTEVKTRAWSGLMPVRN